MKKNYPKKKKRQTLIIGLTGGLGTGKTTVAAMLAKRGAKVWNADKTARRLLNTECFHRVAEVFGKEILAGSKVNRKKLAAVVFNSPGQLRKLEAIIHPAVNREARRFIAAQKAKSVKVVVLEVPLLFESGMNKLADVIVCVNATPSLQVSRSTRRLAITRKEALDRIERQWPLKNKIRLSDFTIDNNSSLTKTRSQVERIFKKVLET